MKITTKGQVTIPQKIREKYGLLPEEEVDFVEEAGKVYLVKKDEDTTRVNPFRKLRGVATIKMTTEEILALTRGK